jgi:hypothetical protein
MTLQVPVTVHAELLDGHQDDVQALLERWAADPSAVGSLDFAALGTIHFARLFLLDQATDLDGDVIPASLLYMADVDGSVDGHLRQLGEVSPGALDRLFAHCVGYPARPDGGTRLAWLRARSLHASAYYVHAVGRTVDQVRSEARLREAVEDLLDEPRDWGPDGEDVAVAVRRMLAARPDLAWAMRPAAGPGLRFRLTCVLQLVLGGTALLLALPLLVPLLAGWVLVLRLLEQADTQEQGAVDVAHLDAVRRYEDVIVQNPFSGAGLVKPGPVRRTTMRVALFGLGAANRLFFHRDHLAGVRTIHFARWQPIDDGRRLIFASSYDGSLESYMDDFISRLFWGINLVFGNGMGFPRTRWVLWAGAQDEISYKHYLRRHLVPTVVFYSAYPSLPATNVDRNASLRAALSTGDARWLEAV